MANTAQAKKRARQAEKHREHNASLRSRFRTAVKKVVNALDKADQEQGQQAYQAAVPTIDGMVSKGLIHKNKASRHKSRLSKRLKKLAETAQA